MTTPHNVNISYRCILFTGLLSSLFWTYHVVSSFVLHNMFRNSFLPFITDYSPIFASWLRQTPFKFYLENFTIPVCSYCFYRQPFHWSAIKYYAPEGPMNSYLTTYARYVTSCNKGRDCNTDRTIDISHLRLLLPSFSPFEVANIIDCYVRTEYKQNGKPHFLTDGPSFPCF